ncbi:conserved hypothetical protein [Vibrio chagasii]|nr:conserved hypothetical protein [Vibrio chagasii]
MTKRIYDKNGYYEIEDNPIARSGIFQYLGREISPLLEPDKVYNVYRPPEELNNETTINSFRLCPWIPTHQMLGDGNTPAENVGVQGTTGERVYFDDGVLYSNIKVFGNQLKELVDTDKKELSIGVWCEYQIKAGISPDGTPYEVIQKNISANHLASVEEGRAGAQVAVMDKAISFALDFNSVKEVKNNMGLKEIMDAVKKLSASDQKKLASMDELTPEKAEDQDPESATDEDTAEDEDPDKGKDEDKPSSNAQDSAIVLLTKAVESLSSEVKEIKSGQSNAMDAQSLMKEINEKNELVNKVSPVIGAFDHSVMDKQAVAVYAVEKIGIACDQGHELAALNGFLSARSTPTYTVDRATDNKAQDNSGLDDALKAGGY